MHHAVLVTSLSLSMAAAPDVAESAAHVHESAPIPNTPGDFLTSLETPEPLGNVWAVVDISDDVNLEVHYDVRSVGAVSIAVHSGDDGSGFGLVTVGETVAAELRFAAGAILRETVDFSGLGPAQAHTVAASMMQVWHEDAVIEALTVETFDDRDLKCTIAGNIAGAVTGVGVFAACELVVKNPVNCGKAGGSAWGFIALHIKNKCNGAQNH